MILNKLTKHTLYCMLAVTWLLTACSGLTKSEKPVMTTWWLEPYTGSTTMTTNAGSLKPVAISLSAIPGLDSNQILTLSADAELKPYAGARWADHAPELLRSLIGRSLDASGRFATTPGAGGRVGESCDLKLELRQFYADLDPGGQTSGVRVALSGWFQCDSSAAIAIDSHAHIKTTDDRMRAIVAAFQKAIDQVTKNILQQIQQDKSYT